MANDEATLSHRFRKRIKDVKRKARPGCFIIENICSRTFVSQILKYQFQSSHLLKTGAGLS